jgi:hypothetical protein
VSDRDAKYSDLVEVIKRNGEFRKWGLFWGPVLYWVSLKAARPRYFRWGSWAAALVGAVGIWVRYGM